MLYVIWDICGIYLSLFTQTQDRPKIDEIDLRKKRQVAAANVPNYAGERLPINLLNLPYLEQDVSDDAGRRSQRAASKEI